MKSHHVSAFSLCLLCLWTGSARAQLSPGASGGIVPLAGRDPTADSVRGESHYPADAELYIPMPTPTGPQGAPKTDGDDHWVTYDFRTRRETVRPKVAGDLAPSSFPAGPAALGVQHPDRSGDQIHTLNFSDLESNMDPREYPWRTTCKLFMRFPDVTGKWSIPFAGSGVLIDSTHVLTAGHCLYYKTEVEIAGTTYQIDGPAHEVIVVPAYEGEVRPFGDALAISADTPSKWRNEFDFNYDMGIVQLDRPVGVITGWLEYGNQEDPDFYTQNVFHNAGYPQAAPFDGEYLYYWYGPFDGTDYDAGLGQWTGNTVFIDRPSYGGQSGSGAYYKESDSSRRVHAVLSYEQPEGQTHFVRITPERRDAIATFIEDSAPANVDLMALAVDIGPASVRPGDVMSNMTFLLHNSSSASWTGNVEFTARLSQDRIITPADIHLGRYYVNWSFEPRSTVIVQMPPFTIPASTRPRCYWIGVGLLIDDEKESDNASGPQDVAQALIGLDKLTNDVPKTTSAGANMFAVDVAKSDWCCVGLRSTKDYVLRLDDNTDFVGACGISRLAGDLRTTCVVGNGHILGDATYYVQVGEMVGAYTVEAAWHIPDLTLGKPIVGSFDALELQDMYEAALIAGTEYELTLDITSGSADLALLVFEPTVSGGSLETCHMLADANGLRGDEQLSFTASTSGSYGIAVLNLTDRTAEYSIGIAAR